VKDRPNTEESYPAVGVRYRAIRSERCPRTSAAAGTGALVGGASCATERLLEPPAQEPRRRACGSLACAERLIDTALRPDRESRGEECEYQEHDADHDHTCDQHAFSSSVVKPAGTAIPVLRCGYTRAVRAFAGRAVRSVRIVIRDGRIPRPIRWGGALGLMPVPGPFDEIVLLLVGAVLWLFYRDQLREAWNLSGQITPSEGPSG
jgi:hypothetical protein